MTGPRSQTLAIVIRANGMSTRPEFTSGRPASVGDLPPKALDAIWEHLRANENESPKDEDQYPVGAADAFVELVDFIKVMSATAFLKALYQLEYDGWKFVEPAGQPDSIQIDGSVGQGFATIASVMFGDGRDDTLQIKSQFRHGRQPVGVRRSYCCW